MTKDTQMNSIPECPFEGWNTVCRADDLFGDAHSELFYIADDSDTHTAVMIVRYFNAESLDKPESDPCTRQIRIRKLAFRYYREAVILKRNAYPGLVEYDTDFRQDDESCTLYIRMDVPFKEIPILNEKEICEQLAGLIRCVEQIYHKRKEGAITPANLIPVKDGLRYSPFPLSCISFDPDMHSDDPVRSICRSMMWYYPDSHILNALNKRIKENDLVSVEEIPAVLSSGFQYGENDLCDLSKL